MIKQLLRTASWYRPIIERVPGFVQILTRDEIYIDFKPHDKNRLWVPLSEHRGKSMRDILPQELFLPRSYYFAKAVQDRRIQRYNQLFISNLTVRDYQISITPLRHEVIVVVRDREATETPYQLFTH